MAGVVYKSPHKARYGHIHLGFSKAKTTEERKAISLNAMHGSLAITDAVYDRMSSDHANKILLSFNFDEKNSSENENVTDNQDSASKSADVNEMMLNLLLSIDPEMLIQTGRFMKMMKKEL